MKTTPAPIVTVQALILTNPVPVQTVAPLRVIYGSLERPKRKTKRKPDGRQKLNDEYWQKVEQGLRDYLNHHIKILSIVRMTELAREIERIKKFRQGNQLTFSITIKSKL